MIKPTKYYQLMKTTTPPSASPWEIFLPATLGLASSSLCFAKRGVPRGRVGIATDGDMNLWAFRRVSGLTRRDFGERDWEAIGDRVVLIACAVIAVALAGLVATGQL